MQKRQPPLAKTADLRDAVSVNLLLRLVESWLLAGDINRHSERTLKSRRERMGSPLWFLRHKEFETCGLHELCQFFHYVTHGHKEPGGRWGNSRMTKPTILGRVKSYHRTLGTFFGWLVKEGEIDASPMARVPPPVDRPDQIQPFSDDQLKSPACRRPAQPRESTP